MPGMYSDFMQKIFCAIDEYGDIHGFSPECIIMHPNSAMLFEYQDNALIERYGVLDMRICGIPFEPNVLFEKGQFLLNNSRMRSIGVKYHRIETSASAAGGLEFGDSPYWELYYVRADGGRIPEQPRIAHSREEFYAIRQDMIRKLGNDYMPRKNDWMWSNVADQQELDRRYSMAMREIIENGYYFNGPEYDGYIKIAKISDGRMIPVARIDNNLKFYCVADEKVIPAIAQKYRFAVGEMEVVVFEPLDGDELPFAKEKKYRYVVRSLF